MIDTKYKAVEYFTFLQKVCARGGCSKCERRFCGVLFYGNYAYSTSNSIIGRIKVYDNIPVNNPIFWSYDRDGEIDRLTRDKFILNTKGAIHSDPFIQNVINNGFTDSFDYYLNRSIENNFYIKKQDLVSFIEDKDLSKAKQNKLKIEVHPMSSGIKLHISPINKTKAMDQSFCYTVQFFTYPGTYDRINIDGETNFTVNLFFLYDVLLNGFSNYDIIKIKYSKTNPIVISGKAANKSEVSFAISQII